jgi:UDP-N-acetylglucosamine 2-epimerase
VKNLARIGWLDRLTGAPHLRVIKPQGYRDFLRLLLDARIVLTDSGGVQREAYFAKRPCVTIFRNTAWPETVEDGWNVCIDADQEKLLEAIASFAPAHPQRAVFGDGHAGRRIVDAIVDFLDDPRPIYV